MKKLTLIVSALALLIGFSQCRKEVINPNTTDQGVHITLNAGYGQNGQRTDFNPAGSFVWTNDATEYVYVGGANHSGCIGVLSGTGNGTHTMTFTGELTATPGDGELLYFFYLGKSRDGSPVNTLDFSSQDGTLENVTNYHIAIGSEEYTTGQTSFSATLDMAMAIAYFDLSGFVSDSKAAETVYLSGNDVYSTATINYKEGTIIGDAKGNINLGTSGPKYVALIPSVNTQTMLRFDSDSKIGGMTFLRGIQTGKFYSGDNQSALAVTANSCLFSVKENKKVKFSPGNLQYQASTDTWRFAEHQYDYIGNAAGNTTATANRSTQSDWIDLFGYGTTGLNGKNPYLATTSSSDYIKTSLTGNDDWGKVIGSSWRTLTQEQWTYLLNRTDKKGTGTVCGVKGVILLPDTWYGSAIVTTCSDWTNNTFTEEQWSAMELAGAVFLPSAGYRNGTTVTSAGSNLYYWSSVMKNTSNAYSVYIYQRSWAPYDMVINTSYDQTVYYGLSVRLVYDVE